MVRGGDAAGGSKAVLGLIDEYGDALEYDLSRFHGIDLRDMWRRPKVLTPRRVLALAHQTLLGETRSALRRVIAPESYGWSREVGTLADLIDRFTAMKFAEFQVKGDYPEYPRPGVEKRKEPEAKVLSMVALVAISQSDPTQLVDDN